MVFYIRILLMSSEHGRKQEIHGFHGMVKAVFNLQGRGRRHWEGFGGITPDFESYCCLCRWLVHFQESTWLIVWAGCCTTSAGRSFSRSGADGLWIPTGWSAVAGHDTSDMLTTSGVTELLARTKGKPTFIIFYLEPPPSPKFASMPLNGYHEFPAFHGMRKAK